MSELLDALIIQRKQQALDYAQYLAKIIELTKKAKNPATGASYPAKLDTPAKQALFDNLGKDDELATKVDKMVRDTKKDGWRGHKVKEKEVKYALRSVIQDEVLAEQIFELVKNQREN